MFFKSRRTHKRPNVAQGTEYVAAVRAAANVRGNQLNAQIWRRRMDVDAPRASLTTTRRKNSFDIHLRSELGLS